MSKKKYDHLAFWERCMRSGELPQGSGLCDESELGHIDPELLELFKPTEYDKEWIEWEGHCPIMWGSGLINNDPKECGAFTLLRQTIVLFMAAMNKEL